MRFLIKVTESQTWYFLDHSTAKGVVIKRVQLAILFQCLAKDLAGITFPGIHGSCLHMKLGDLLLSKPLLVRNF